MVIRNCPNCKNHQSKCKYVIENLCVVKCSNCSLVFLGNPSHEGSLYDEYYDTIAYDAKDYNRFSKFKSLSELFIINEQRLDFIKRERKSGRLLDIGCGQGFFLKTAQEHGFDIYGIDVSKRAVLYASNTFGIKASVKTLDDLLIQDKTFDLITLWHVLEHFVNPVEELQKIRRLLANDGVCIIEVPNLHSLKFILSRNKWVGGNHPLYHRSFFTNKSLVETLLRSGFSRTKRIQISYHIDGRNNIYEAVKNILNSIAMDAFLNFIAWK